MIDEYGSALVADLRSVYGVDIRDLWRDDSRLTPRSVLWLVEHLPQDSATIAKAKGGPKHRVWTSEAHLLALIANLLHVSNRQRAGKSARKPLITPPKIKVNKARGRVVRVADVNARRMAALARTRAKRTDIQRG
ncbi:MAG TPA: hypothetical protein VK735_44170 [Pseudonocardia sp.]|uniref:hypothetical protein n=1 Tax=Pseudonocardia sp. TaxID=60912 RepID=UPI002B8246D6|nr:hypothetical protein [Pseudonocardia sp.]HTF54482.1 hypothetical protein [Pseudonocardia sp.]